ncbi:hypothetical protein Afil01_68500 [Actinorhabdospora filicis]|uniref:non-specific serine/threonine protein kinase n=1 Tax=Actinorhabdospora filicis TaxID=1785913 RepID=A0A9W6WDF3_9ACTN|nr:hypothetical protein [Actinorhabdospora filicis]GLZ82043.1 hypothetical protein Afil01_68500 [Actinorhabdospora filicis]
MTAPAPFYRDDTASVFAVTAPGGGPAIMVAGHLPVAASRFDPWARALLAVAAGPGLARIHQAAREPDGRPVLVVDAGGVTLAERLTTSGPLPVAEAHTAALSLAETLSRVHAAGLWHGAICPSTVVLQDGVLLAGFDACAPGLAKPVTGRFAAPEGAPGPAADVYALAATVYLALGGRPGESTADLYDVPPPLTAILRAALAADPAQRPTAAQLRQALTTVGATENILPTAPLPAALVGSDVRPVNQAVVNINIAIAGAAAAGAATAAGVIAGKALPGMLGAGAKTGAGLALKIGAGALAAAVVATGVAVAINVLSEEEAPAPREPLVTAIQQFDFANATFTDADRGTTAALQGGKSEPFDYDKSTGGYRLGDPPIVYADADGDNDQDAMVMLVQEGGNGFFESVYIWLWQDGKAVQIPHAIADGGRCGSRVGAFTGEADRFRLTRDIVVATPTCAQPQYQSETVAIGVRQGFPVTLEPGFGAAASCIVGEYEEAKEITGYKPLLAPDDLAPAVGEPEEFTRLEAILLTYSGADNTWARVRMTRTDGSVVCGWLRGDRLK